MVQFSSLAQSGLTLRDHMDCSLPGSSAHGIFQARVLEWGAIAFTNVNYDSLFLQRLTKLLISRLCHSSLK